MDFTKSRRALQKHVMSVLVRLDLAKRKGALARPLVNELIHRPIRVLMNVEP
jgi:hypothetical protein